MSKCAEGSISYTCFREVEGLSASEKKLFEKLLFCSLTCYLNCLPCSQILSDYLLYQYSVSN